MDKTNENKGLGDYEGWMAAHQFRTYWDFGTPISEQYKNFSEAIKAMVKEAGLRSYDGQKITEVVFTLINDKISQKEKDAERAAGQVLRDLSNG